MKSTDGDVVDNQISSNYEYCNDTNNVEPVSVPNTSVMPTHILSGATSVGSSIASSYVFNASNKQRMMFPPLRINIPSEHDLTVGSPFPSPTGTIR